MSAEGSALAVRSLEEAPAPAPGRRFALKDLYNFLNREIFDGGLPQTTRVIWSEQLTQTFGLTSAACAGRAAGCIKLNKRLLHGNPSRDLLIDVLLHEMLHEWKNQFAPNDGAHGAAFQAEMHRINTEFGRNVSLTFDSPFCDRALEKLCVHRWKCNTCDFTVKKTRNVPPGAGRLVEHTGTGCTGELKKLTPAEAKADIAACCAASLAKEL